MIIIPELQTVLLQPPRTGTTSVRDAVLLRYPKAFLLYRHMEADGIPFGYRHWRVVSQVRNPATRLMSVFKYMREPIIKARTNMDWRARMMKATENGFDAWLLDKEIFTSSMLPSGPDYRPRDAVKWSYPEQVKSQKLWAGDADVMLLHEDLVNMCRAVLGVDIEHKNASKSTIVDHDPELFRAHLLKFHAWDCDAYGIE